MLLTCSMAESPLSLVFPTGPEIDVHFTLTDGRLLFVRMDDTHGVQA